MAVETTDSAVEHPAVTTEGRRLLTELVSIPSVSGNETEAAEALAAFLEQNGRETYIDDIGNVHAPGDDTVLLTSHIDTVPGDIPVEIKEGEEGPELWGRGSVDATGPLAAMAVAAVETGASFVGVVGEESTSRGAWHLIENREAPEAVINGEPSGWDGITLGYRGLLEGTYVATSESGHTSRPDPNAIQHAMSWWNRVEDTFEPDEWIPVFEQVTTKPVDIEGGVSVDGLSMDATMEFQLRVPPERTPEEVRELSDAELETGTVNWTEFIPAVMTSPRTEVARLFRVAIRKQGGDPRLLRKTGTADMNIYAEEWGCPILSYGPGDSNLDHTPHEHLSLAEFDHSVDVLIEVCEQLGVEQPDDHTSDETTESKS
ncbi:acetylornithine deacetylase [Halohasta litchfieldiae]|jgi:LysW-gamma-L-lysine carboxypeptidase|uniref:Putative [LysW]-lysine/[LysW]-ornithine hydrolase n=1 Tax=Halohasta litchfieldiae TaxID=1073996 RepID=A0A1H6R3C4_9EURY|nr:[LysW]-lysine hydrolase [Halohasta litchfieldiae]ATW88630.1 acetylornithine deacetylase [Halohasta litchfieldiae]SEI47714.1 acetylornithine deacetylase [Halohasta litchfieldiae]